MSRTEQRPPGLRLQGVSKVFDTKDAPVIAVSDVNLIADSGELVALLGPSRVRKDDDVTPNRRF